MPIKLAHAPGRPLFAQIRDILKARIQSRAFKDRRLPSVRHVAKEFGVSPNTVLRAFDALRQQGLISGAVGKGTFVARAAMDLQNQTRRELLEKTIEHALEEALALEFSIEEFQAAVQAYIQDKLEMMRAVRLVFVECNTEQLTFFTEHLELDPHIQPIPLLLQDLREQSASLDVDADIVVTSFYHLEEVRERLNHLGKPIVGINLEADVKTLIEIAKIPPTNTVGIVTTSAQCRQEIREILEAADIRFAHLLETNDTDPAVVNPLVAACGAVLVTPGRKSAVQRAAGAAAQVIEFVFKPDKTSINNLKVAVLEIKKSIL